ncbi:hypothetical protein B9Z55_021851 [Caenorhabditis nigoni]|uniref:Uncharacterized protein n=1 Tax=Caenorhabditis nigoni TaxID=1611254 RepID=A0A2G5TUS5_9PELO|nr:hypothetical protein B9Z55_021851 [Caenorhabditis nigoni]
MISSAHRLWHQADGAPRPTVISGRRSNRTHHDQPAPPQPVEYSSFRDFFQQDRPFNVTDIEEFARLESTWPTSRLPIHVMAGAALRLFVWTARRPSPEEHYNEVVKRLPFLGHRPELKPFFMVYARAALEPRGEGATSRCPLCGSHLLGYPMADHSIQHCPLRGLEGQNRLAFLAINHVGYCQRCNSRSKAHYADNCQENEKRCSHCKEFGHTSALPLCRDQALLHLRYEDLKPTINTLRKQFLTRVRTRMALEPFNYRLYVDASYAHLKIPPHPERLVGWKIYKDDAKQFPEIPEQSYANAARNLPTAYNRMVPEELLENWVQWVPRFSPRMVGYLNNIGHLVTRVRNNIEIDPVSHSPISIQLMDALQSDLPMFPYEEEGLSPPRPSSQMPSTSGTQPSTSGYQRPLPNRSEIPVRPWRSPPIIKPPSVQDVRELGPRRQVPSVSGSDIAQLEIYRARMQNFIMRPLTAPIRSRSRSAVSSRSNVSTAQVYHIYPVPIATYDLQQSIASTSSANQTSASDSEEQFNGAENSNHSRLSSISEVTTDPAPVQSNNSDETIVTVTHTVARQLLNIPLQEDQAELENEIKTAQITRTWCGEVIRMKDTPARSTFEKRAFQRMTAIIPEGLRANIVKAQTMVFMLTGSEIMLNDDRSKYSVDQLKRYNAFLMDVANSNVAEKLLLVALEGKTANFCSAVSKGSHHLPIPSLDVFCHESAVKYLQRMSAEQYKWKTPSAAPPSRWFRDVEEDKESQEKGNLQVRFTPYTGGQRNTELLKLVVNMAVPRSPNDLFARLQWLQPFLITSPVEHPIGHYDNHVIHGYTHTLMALANLLLEIDRATSDKVTVKVTVANCYRELAMTANGGHSIVLPTIELFRESPLSKWNIWLTTAWDNLMDCHDWTNQCSCHHA